MAKTKKTAPEKPKQGQVESDTSVQETFLAALKRLRKPSSSREISDALGIKDPESGRALVRRMMQRLIADGKVEAVESDKKNIGKLYKLP